MTYLVERLDYPAIVEKLAKAGLNGMAAVVVGQLAKLDKPKWANELTFFWRSLYNAARTNDLVWFWLMTQPDIRNFAPTGAEHYTMPGLAPEAKLPLIGGIDDTPYEPTDGPKQWSTEPTEENLREQAIALDAFFRADVEKRPGKLFKCVDDYVATFYYSGTGKILARTQLTEVGFRALATEAGVQYLMDTYPPPNERKKLWFVRRSVFQIAKEFPFASIDAHGIEVKPPETEEQFNANARLWMTVFRELYASRETIKTLPAISFFHQLPSEPAPIDHYTAREQFFKRHPRLAKLCWVNVKERTVAGETIEIEARGANLLFGDSDRLDEGVISFCLTQEERARIAKPGMQGSIIMLPITHPCKLNIIAGAIRRITLP